jgi:hypothetical protein
MALLLQKFTNSDFRELTPLSACHALFCALCPDFDAEKEKERKSQKASYIGEVLEDSRDAPCRCQLGSFRGCVRRPGTHFL